MLFTNCPLADFTNKSIRKSYQEALDSCWRTFPQDIPLLIAGKEKH